MSRLRDFFKLGGSLRRKMLYSLFLTFLLILGAVLSYVTIKSEQLALNNARELAQSYANGYAKNIQDRLNIDMGMARALSHSLHGFTNLPVEQRMSIDSNMMYNIASQNEEFLAVWTIWERKTFDTTWTLPYGRGRFTIFREKGQLKYREELLDLEGDKVDGAYYKMKVSKEETILNPYSFTYSGNEEDAILETSLCVPILQNDQFIGLAGMDISLESYQRVVNQVEPIEGSQLYLLANDNSFVTHPDDNMLGEHFNESFPALVDTFSIEKHVSDGEPLSFEYENGKTYFYSFAPIYVGKSTTPWSLMLKAPLDTIMEEARRGVFISLIVGLIGLALMTVIVWIISRSVTRPIKSTTRVLQKLAKGNLEDITTLEVTSKDELQDMSDSLNTLMSGLQHTAEFARSIGEGKLDTEYNLLSENDTLGHALLDMQESLRNARLEQKRRNEEEERQNWITEGLAKFGDILRKNNDNLKQLSFNIMKNLVDYIGASQGCIYVRTDDEEEEKYQLTSAIAYDRRKLLKDVVEPGDGLIGRVVHEKLTIYMTDVPDDYVFITSGLGEANPKSILIVPLILNDEVYGALELVSFNEFEKYHIQFVEQIAESIASTISSVKVTERTNRLLKESQHQREELSSQEEEMRQNLEELKATQEEAARRETEMNALIEALGSSVLITEFDLDGMVLNINHKCVDLLGIQPEKMRGKHHKSLGLDNTTASGAYKKFWSDLNRGKTKKRISEVNIAGKTKYIEETYIPVTDSEGTIHKIVGIGYDFTKVKEKDLEIERLKNELDQK
ncbi:MAG TPA: GAF domain-containing protein [Salinivirga sp.]|uniref:GAF domain-containing protein n=1 Tax=Salinivirga sp. TaxID=1970192 RepID=UPI002B4736F0|nr:GAF domain-containing protein [Salinivirga sp.]HKK59208.1 GAF domain-containing protein [Salinivirga sp.]